MTFAKRCKLENSSKNTAKSIVFKVQKSDAPKNKSQLASRGVPRPPGTPLIYVPGGGVMAAAKKFLLSFSYVGNFETISSENFHRNLIIYTYLRQKKIRCKCIYTIIISDATFSYGNVFLWKVFLCNVIVS